MTSNIEKKIIKFIKINDLTSISLLDAISKRANIAVAHGTDSKTLKLALTTILAKYVDSVNHTTDDPLIGSISFIKTESGVECYIGSELICTIGESSSITIDTELDKDSENAIANSAVAEAIENLADSIPTVDTELDKTSDNAISNKAVAEALDNAEDNISSISTELDNTKSQVETNTDDISKLQEDVLKAKSTVAAGKNIEVEEEIMDDGHTKYTISAAAGSVFEIIPEEWGITVGDMERDENHHYTEEQYDLMYNNIKGVFDACMEGINSGAQTILFPENQIICFTPVGDKDSKTLVGFFGIKDITFDLNGCTMKLKLDSSQKSKYYTREPSKTYSYQYTFFGVYACKNILFRNGTILGDMIERDFTVSDERKQESGSAFDVSCGCKDIHIENINGYHFAGDFLVTGDVKYTRESKFVFINMEGTKSINFINSNINLHRFWEIDDNGIVTDLSESKETASKSSSRICCTDFIQIPNNFYEPYSSAVASDVNRLYWGNTQSGYEYHDNTISRDVEDNLIYFYDSEQNFILKCNFGFQQTVEIPHNAKYFRMAAIGIPAGNSVDTYYSDTILMHACFYNVYNGNIYVENCNAGNNQRGMFIADCEHLYIKNFKAYKEKYYGFTSDCYFISNEERTAGNYHLENVDLSGIPSSVQFSQRILMTYGHANLFIDNCKNIEWTGAKGGNVIANNCEELRIGLWAYGLNISDKESNTSNNYRTCNTFTANYCGITKNSRVLYKDNYNKYFRLILHKCYCVNPVSIQLPGNEFINNNNSDYIINDEFTVYDNDNRINKNYNNGIELAGNKAIYRSSNKFDSICRVEHNPGKTLWLFINGRETKTIDAGDNIVNLGINTDVRKSDSYLDGVKHGYAEVSNLKNCAIYRQSYGESIKPYYNTDEGWVYKEHLTISDSSIIVANQEGYPYADVKSADEGPIQYERKLKNCNIIQHLSPFNTGKETLYSPFPAVGIKTVSKYNTIKDTGLVPSKVVIYENVSVDAPNIYFTPLYKTTGITNVKYNPFRDKIVFRNCPDLENKTFEPMPGISGFGHSAYAWMYGKHFYRTIGTYFQRPIFVDDGFLYFDTTLNKMIVKRGIAYDLSYKGYTEEQQFFDYLAQIPLPRWYDLEGNDVTYLIPRRDNDVISVNGTNYKFINLDGLDILEMGLQEPIGNKGTDFACLGNIEINPNQTEFDHQNNLWNQYFYNSTGSAMTDLSWVPSGWRLPTETDIAKIRTYFTGASLICYGKPSGRWEPPSMNDIMQSKYQDSNGLYLQDGRLLNGTGTTKYDNGVCYIMRNDGVQVNLNTGATRTDSWVPIRLVRDHV